MGAAKRALIIIYLIGLHGALAGLLIDKFVFQPVLRSEVDPNLVRPPAAGPQVTPVTLPTELPTPLPQPSPSLGPAVQQPQVPGSMMIPVHGITADKLTDTFSDSRSEGRTHEAIDIMAPAGTPVVAAADGEIVKFLDSKAGGITIYQVSTDRKYFFYYSHLQSRAPGIAEKQSVTRGTVIGYVGDTGNAGPGNYHLHFAISTVVDPNRFWEGDNINPYPILKGEAGLR